MLLAVICKYVTESLAAIFSDTVTNQIKKVYSFSAIPTQLSIRGGEFGLYYFRLIKNWECDRSRGGSPQKTSKYQKVNSP